jgi:hypothetical protein
MCGGVLSVKVIDRCPVVFGQGDFVPGGEVAHAPSNKKIATKVNLILS